MRVQVFVPAFAKIELLDDDNFIELNEGCSLRNLQRKLRVPLIYRPFVSCLVNYEKVSFSTKLKEGDVVSFYTVVSGG